MSDLDPFAEEVREGLDPKDALRFFFVTSRLPFWARAPFIRCFVAWEGQVQTLELAVLGIGRIEQQDEVVHARWFDDSVSELEEGDFLREMIERGRRDTVEQAAKRSDRILVSQAVVLLWGGIETVIEDFLAAWYQRRPETLYRNKGSNQEEAKDKIKISLAELEGITPEWLGRYVIHTLKQKLTFTDKTGINRFQKLLDEFGLSLHIDDDIRNTLWELGHIRNVIVHRNGRADAKFIKDCPSFGVAEGQLVFLTREHYTKYARAAYTYIFSVITRLDTEFGWTRVRDEETGEMTWRYPTDPDLLRILNE